MSNSLIYENEQGFKVELTSSKPFLLQKFEGLGSVKNNISSFKSPYQDGATKQSSSLEVRDISLQGVVLADSSELLMSYRRDLIRTFNPKIKGKLIYVYEGGEKEINCEVEEAPIFPYESSPLTQVFNIGLVALDPFFQDTFFYTEEITTWIGGLSFQFSFPVTFAVKGESSRNIKNDGDVETPIEITFKGAAINPKIVNTSTGEFIRIKRTLSSDDTLIINTEFGNKKVEIVKSDGSKQNAFNYIDLNSTFFQLVQGDNVLEYSTDGLDPSSVSIKYRNKYLGV